MEVLYLLRGQSHSRRLSHILAHPAVRLIDVDGDQIGIINPKKALTIAREKELDLIEVAPNADPPVCRIVDYGKYKYKQSKREKARKQSQNSKTKTKEIKLRPATAEHDYQFKKQHAEEFLLSGAKVILTVMFKGRQRTHPELGAKMLRRMIKELSGVGEALSRPKMNGYHMSVVMIPRSSET
jgi:translation initiation factor IF-3